MVLLIGKEKFIPCRWDDAGSFHEGMAFVQNDKENMDILIIRGI